MPYNSNLVSGDSAGNVRGVKAAPFDGVHSRPFRYKVPIVHIVLLDLVSDAFDEYKSVNMGKG